MAVYRNEATVARIQRMLTLIAVVGIGVGAIGLSRGLAAEGAARTLWAGIGLALVGLVAVALGWRLGRVAVETDAEGVEIRNLLSTRRLAWSEVASFEEVPRRRGFTNAVARTNGGKDLPLSALGDPGTTSGRLLLSLRKELEASRRA